MTGSPVGAAAEGGAAPGRAKPGLSVNGGEEFVSPDERRMSKRAEALRHRRSLWEWSSLARQRKCGSAAFTPQGGAILRATETDQGTRAGVAGLQSCGLWTCPVCVRSVSAERAREVSKVLKAAAERKCSVSLASFTMKHHNGVSIRACWDALGKAWRSATSGSVWQKHKQQFGLVGWVRAVELTVGANGPHVHAHVLLVFDSLISSEMQEEFAYRMWVRWNRTLTKHGFGGSEERGVDVRPVQLTGESIEATAAYVAKASFEAVSSATKQGRKTSSRAPMEILADAVATGNADDIELFWEIEQSCHGRKKLTWSNGIRDWAKLGKEKTDEEAANENKHGENVLVMPKATWNVVKYELEGLLDTYERQGLLAARRWLDSRGLDYRIPSGDKNLVRSG
jgi:hypothetical protein